jgi:hypothetical protein
VPHLHEFTRVRVAQAFLPVWILKLRDIAYRIRIAGHSAKRYSTSFEFSDAIILPSESRLIKTAS